MPTSSINRFTTALRFLTIFPAEEDAAELPDHELGKSLAFFPIVGFCMGIVLYLCRSMFSRILPNSLVNIFILTIHLMLSRGLHMDGFADTIDGFGGGYNSLDRLSIMKDTNIGTFGVCGIVILILGKFAALNNLSAGSAASAIIIMPVIGRLAMVFLSYISTSVKGREGIGRAFVDRIAENEFWTATISGAILSVIFAGSNGILVIVVVLTFCIAFEVYVKRQIGGINGDILGAACESSELLVLIIFTILESRIVYHMMGGLWL